MPLDQTIAISPSVLTQKVSGEMVLLDTNSEQYLGLNEVGTRIWQLIQDEPDLNSVFEMLLEEYDVEADLLKNDLNQLIAEMNEAGLITITETKS